TTLQHIVLPCSVRRFFRPECSKRAARCKPMARRALGGGISAAGGESQRQSATRRRRTFRQAVDRIDTARRLATHLALSPRRDRLAITAPLRDAATCAIRFDDRS